MEENKLVSGHTIKSLKEKDEEKLRKNYFVYSNGAVKLHPGNLVFPTHFLKYSTAIYNFKVRPSDIFVFSYPKSGTTWMQEIIWNLVHNPDVDNPLAETPLDERFPNIEADMFLATPGVTPPNPLSYPMLLFNIMYPFKSYIDIGLFVSLIGYAPSPRMYKSHLPLSLLPPDILKTSKSLYVARDPRDMISSFYHYIKLHLLWGFKGTLDDCIDDILNDRVIFGPYWSHMKKAWDLRKHPNFCFVFYEDLKSDNANQMKRINNFLGTERDEKQMKKIAQFTSFSEMKERSKKNPPTSNDKIYFNKKVEMEEGGFFRKGQVGDWKKRFTQKQIQKINKWTARNLKHFGDDFKYKV